jgi:hypothetical protein
MKGYVPARDVHFRELARQRIILGDLFTYAVAVVTIKTKKQYYGAISRAVAARNIPFPDLALGCAEYVEVSPGSGFIFVALWNDDNVYSPSHVYNCTRACLKQASRHALPQVAFPLLGGNERHKFIGAMEQAVDDAMDETDECDEHMPEVVFVTDHELL